MAHRLLCLLSVSWFALTGSAFADPPRHNSLTPKELAEGWILLFDGQTGFGWRATSKADWKVAGGVISVGEGAPGFLHTTSQFGDFQLKVDFRAPADTNSGVFLRTSPRPQDPARDCYELNIAHAENSPFPTGGFVGRKKNSGGNLHTPGWHTYEVSAQGAKFTVKLDGKQVLDYTDEQPLGRGYISLQLNQGRVEFRNIKLKPLGLKSLFNGRDLSGWKVFPGKKSVFSVNRPGELNVKNGPGQLETAGQWSDFTLQLGILSGGKHLNSGVFFRSIPGEFWQGYESQIHNGYKDGDRGQPLDYGTGGFYRRQKARRVVADDFAWFHKTLIVTGDHMAVWVNGYPVSDWTDTRKPNENPRRGLRREPGTLIIQGHDPTTNLSFRNVRIIETPPRGK